MAFATDERLASANQGIFISLAPSQNLNERR